MYYSPSSYYPAGIGIGVLILFIIMFIIALAFAVIQIVSRWIIFKKAGQEGWLSLIPICNTWVLFKICWKTRYYAWLLILSATTLVLWIFTLIPFIGLIFGIINFLIGIVIAVLSLVLTIGLPFKLAAAFGKDTLFGVGLWLLPPIFYPILAFGNSTYIGKPDNTGFQAPTVNNVVNIFQPQDQQPDMPYYQQQPYTNYPNTNYPNGQGYDPGSFYYHGQNPYTQNGFGNIPPQNSMQNPQYQRQQDQRGYNQDPYYPNNQPNYPVNNGINSRPMNPSGYQPNQQGSWQNPTNPPQNQYPTGQAGYPDQHYQQRYQNNQPSNSRGLIEYNQEEDFEEQEY